jgi:hypothetical protein
MGKNILIREPLSDPHKACQPLVFLLLRTLPYHFDFAGRRCCKQPRIDLEDAMSSMVGL